MDDIKVLMTARADAPQNNSIAETAAGVSDIEVITMSVWAQVGVRVLRTYLQSVLGFILAVGTGAASGMGINIPAQDFFTLFMSSASLAVAPAVVSLLQNTIELLSKMDATQPQLRG